MANKKLQIEVEVNTSQVDKAVEKTGELKKLSKDISIQYDIDGKPIDLVINKSLNLQKQVRALTAELRRTKEGTAEFQLLSTRLGDAQDQLAATNAKSRDLLGSLQLIPGPIGDIASKLNGAISLLKTFSSFSLKDVRFQFKETVNDISDIFKNFLGLGEVTKNVSESTQDFNDNLEGTSIQASAVNKNLNETNGYLKANSTFLLKNTDAVKENFDSIERRRLTIKKLDSGLVQATVTEDGYIQKTKIATLTTKGLVIAEEQATVATTALTVAWNALKIALGGILIGGIIIGLTKLYEVLKEVVTGAKAAEKENLRLAGSFKALQQGIKDTEDVIKVEGQVALNEAKKRGASIEELTNLERKNLDDRVEANKKARKQLETEQLNLIKNFTINEEQRKERQKEIDDAIAENSRKAGDLRLERILFESNASVNIQKDADDRRLKDLEARIKLEIDKENTSKKELEQLLKEKLAIRIVNEKLTTNEIKVAQAENSKIVKDALDSDAKVQIDYLQKIEDIRVAAIQDDEQRQLEARENKRYNDLIALSSDIQFQKKSEAERADVIKNINTATENDLLKIREQFFLKRLQQQQEFKLRENEALTRGIEAEAAINQQRLDDGIKFNELYSEFIFGDKGFKAMLEKRFVDLREAYNQEYLANEEQFRKDEEALKNSLEQKRLTQEQFDLQMEALGQKRIQNAQTNTQRQLQLDKLEVDSKRASADMTIQIGQNLVGLLGALNKKSVKLQKAAAILDAGVSIARIITDTSRGIIAFTASVAPLGPAGIPIAAGYALKSKIAAGLAIATIVAQGIGKLKSIDENSVEQSAGGGEAKAPMANYGRNYEKGGKINGRRHAQGGVMIEAEGGEAIMTRGAVSLFGPLLSMMNQAGGGASFNSNLITTRQDKPILNNPQQEQSPLIVKTYVVSQELTTEQEKQARLKNLSTL